MAPRKRTPAKKKRPAASAHRQSGRKVGTRDEWGVKVRSAKQMKGWDAAKKAAYKSRTSTTGPVYLYDRTTGVYTKHTSSGTYSTGKARGGYGPTKRYVRVSERTFNAGQNAGPDAHRTWPGGTSQPWSRGDHTDRKTVIKKRKKKLAAGKKKSKWAGRTNTTKAERTAAQKKAAYAKKKRNARNKY